MKTVMEYLQERKEIADHNLFCCSATYAMDRPKEGMQELFNEAVRDCEIVDELTALVETQKASAVRTPQCGECPLKGRADDLLKVLKMMDELENYAKSNFHGGISR